MLVKVRAASVNPLDWHYLRGEPYVLRLLSSFGKPDDLRLGADVSGTVEAVGRSVTRFKAGNAVFGATGGAFAEHVKISEDRGLALKPADISFEEAAAVPIA